MVLMLIHCAIPALWLNILFYRSRLNVDYAVRQAVAATSLALLGSHGTLPCKPRQIWLLAQSI